MNLIDLEQLLSQFDLRRVGEIKLAEDRLGFDLTFSPKDTGYVYAWVEHYGGEAVVVYVGKAGRTLRARCNQHTNGFRSSKTGQAHATRVRQGLANMRQYFVYARKSSVSEVLGVQNVPMECVEEIALIRHFDPSWNALS